MSSIKVALLQMTSHNTDQEANLIKGEDFCQRAAQLGADIALFPEMWNIGYSFFDNNIPGDYDKWTARAIGRDSEFVNHYRRLAEELNMAIAVTYLEKWAGAPRNTVSLIDRYGEMVLTYAKVHTCDFSPERSLIPGDDFYVCSLDTANGNVNVGCMICYDREHPESARILMLKGAELVLTPNACRLDPPRINQFGTRSFENVMGLAMTNYAAPQENGHSVAFTPVNRAQSGNDMLIVEAGESEGIYPAVFDMDAIREFREHTIWGNAYRKPDKYGLLTSNEVQPPFVRGSDRR